MTFKNSKGYKLSDLFVVDSSKDKNLLSSKNGTAKYLSATAANNGVGDYVDGEPIRGYNTITIARNGSVGSAFYHSYNYFASPDDIRILYPKFALNKYIAIFLCVLIEQEKFRYTYGRKFGTDRIKNTIIYLPTKNNTPDWNLIENYIKVEVIPQLSSKAQKVWEESYKTHPLSHESKELRTEGWQEFRYDEIFKICKGFYNKKPDEVPDGDIPFIGATDSNNGITSMCDIETIESTSKTGDENNAPLEEKIFEPPCITVSNNGSVGYAFYQERRFTCTHDVNPLYLLDKWGVKLNKYIGIFLCTVIELDRYRWTYGRKWRPSRMPSSIIKLPVDPNGNPDWQFMEDYIKSLPYSANL